MGEEVKITDSHNQTERVTEWEMGLPTADDLTPLSQPLIPPELASAFSISPEPFRTLVDVNQASEDTISVLRGGGSGSQALSSNREATVLEAEEEEGDRNTESRKVRKIDCGTAEEADSAPNNNNSEDASARTLKRPRLVWTPQLHKRFVDVVAHLGIKNAVPKTIMQLMNVEGLTRENVASHLQKYRLYLKRMQGLSNEGPSSSDQLFASTPVPQSLHDSAGHSHGNGNRNGNGHLPLPYPPPHMMPMPMIGMPPHMRMPVQHQHPGDWSANKYASLVSYPNTLTPSDK